MTGFIERRAHLSLLSAIFCLCLAVPTLLSGYLAVAADPLPATPAQVPAPVLQVTYANKHLSITAKDADVRDVFKAISEKTGVQVEVFAGVTGKVDLTLEKVPLETAVDRLLGSVGQRNYLMAYQGDGLQKLTIVPKSVAGPSGAEEIGKIKVKGKLRNGKEIEFFPGEILVWLKYSSNPRREQDIAFTIHRLEQQHSLSEISRAHVFGSIALQFRILNGRDVLTVMREILDNREIQPLLSHASPNGLGQASIGMPEEGFRVEQLTPQDYNNIKERGIAPRQYRMQKYPFLREGAIPGYSESSIPYVEGQYVIYVHGEDRERITYDEILDLVNSKNGIVIQHFSVRDGESYDVYFPSDKSVNDAGTRNTLLKSWLVPLKTNRYTNATPLAWPSKEE
jgi:hypothetical protein